MATITRKTDAREGKVYVDYLQNGHGRLLVAPFCVRPMAAAPISMPLTWTQVNRRLSIGRYTIKTAPKLMARAKNDPMLGVLHEAPDLVAALNRLAGHLG